MKLCEKSICIGIPTLNDSRNISSVIEKSIRVLSAHFIDYEIIVIDDGSSDGTYEIIKNYEANYHFVSVFRHHRNMGYGFTLKEIISKTSKTWVCFVDGDDEYDISELKKITPLLDFYDLIITFRYLKRYSNFRVFVSFIFNRVLSFLFRTNYRDISTGLRLVKSSVVKTVTLISDSTFIGAEMAIKISMKGYRVGEVGIQTFPDNFGKSYSMRFSNIVHTIKDMISVREQIFSKSYDFE